MPSRSPTPWTPAVLRAFPRRERLPVNQRARPALIPTLRDQSADLQGEEFARSTSVALLEAVLLLADEPQTVRRLAQLTGLRDATEVRAVLQSLQDLQDREGSAFRVEEVAGGFQMLTRPAFYPWLARLRQTGPDWKLTPAARETLAIIAYRQPIMRADLEAIRGVQSAEVLRQLMEKNLIRITGRDDSLGRPVLYGTTKKFLQWLGLRGLRDLPRASEFAATARPRPLPATDEPSPEIPG